MGARKRIRRLAPDKESRFPQFASSHYAVTSDEDVHYNCIAYAAGDQGCWWDCPDIPCPGKRYYWPPNAQRGLELAALVSAFGEIGYALCDSPKWEVWHDKVALYADASGNWQHAARQTIMGRWRSKLGEWEDIWHETLWAVDGSGYGKAVCYMKRPRVVGLFRKFARSVRDTARTLRGIIK